MRRVIAEPQFHRKCTEDMASEVSSTETSIFFTDVSSSHLLGSGRSRRNQGDAYREKWGYKSLDLVKSSGVMTGRYIKILMKRGTNLDFFESDAKLSVLF